MNSQFSDSTPPTRCDELLAILTERAFTASEHTEFQNILRRSPEALDRYLDHCEMETWLAAAGKGLDSASDGSPVPASVLRPTSSSRLRRWVWLPAAAAALAIMLLGANAIFQKESPVAPVGPQPSAAVLAESSRSNDGADSPTRDPWKTISSTGSLKHPALIAASVPVPATQRPIRFNRDVRPILSETCFHCHGPDAHGRRADLRLDLAEGAKADLGGYQAIVPHDLAKSEAWSRILSTDPEEQMPPPESHLVLTETQKETLRRWIVQGAEYEGHWAWSPPQPPAPPAPATATALSEIDAFIQARLVEEGMAPAPEAKPEALIRRLSFDLVGLPPAADEVESFVADYKNRGEAAWQDAITRLLDSPHFGERMAVPWLDQARYADTNGYSIDGGRDMWLWRDWVIQAYNTNMPFDRFATEQLAGDLLPDATDATRTATGFNRNHMITHEGGTIPEENLANYTADRVKTTSEVFLGLTMGCAQCHDHKYDPVSQKEYYEFFAFFNQLSDRGLDGNSGINSAPKLLAKTVLPTDELPSLQAELAELDQAWRESREGFAEWVREMRQRETTRGQDFATVPLTALDVSSPNRPGPYEIQADSSIYSPEPSNGLNGFSHALQIPLGQNLTGLRVSFFPAGPEKKLTPHKDGVPRVTTLLVSAGKLPAKQVDIYQQLVLARATASQSAPGHAPKGMLDERNLQWWEPTLATEPTHFTLTFSEPVDPAETPFLSVLLFFGTNDSMPYHWRIDGIRGADPDSEFSGPVSAALVREESTWTPEERSLVEATFRETAPVLETVRVRLANLTERISVLTEAHSTMVMDTSATPRETFVLDRGQYDAPLEKVTPQTPRVLPALAIDPAKPATRLDLARWLTDPQNPLTARVAVNRIWGLFFGTGLVATSADFGSQGEWPSHPELLDWLAADFVASGWDQQALIRRIVSSSTYRQDSFASPAAREKDPKNRLLARGPRFRLPAEFIRDQALTVSGLLVPRIGGPSVFPYQPPGLWKEVSHFGSTPATSQVFVQDHGEKLYRRSLYTYVKRTSPSPSMSAFDAPNRELCTVDRGVTNTPLQALVTLNDPQFAEAARVYAAKLLRATANTTSEDRLRLAFREIVGRAPVAGELDTLSSFLTDEANRWSGDPDKATQSLMIGEAPPAPDLDPVSHAVWTQVSSLLLNLSESLTRS